MSMVNAIYYQILGQLLSWGLSAAQAEAAAQYAVTNNLTALQAYAYATGKTTPPSGSNPNPIPNPPIGVIPTLNFTANNWTGYVTDADFDLIGNTLSLGPAPAGTFSQIEALLIVALARKLVETPHGQTMLRDIIVKYLESIAKVIGSIYHAGTQNWMNGLVGNRVAVDIYARMGLMSPRDAMLERAWIDHQIGEMLLTQRAGMGIDAVTTMINQAETQTAAEKGASPQRETGIAEIVGLLKGLK